MKIFKCDHCGKEFNQSELRQTELKSGDFLLLKSGDFLLLIHVLNCQKERFASYQTSDICLACVKKIILESKPE